MIVKRNSGTRQLEKYYHLIGWGTPCISVIVVAATQNYGETALVNGTCYIQNNVLIFATFFLPGLILISANAVLFFFRGVGDSRYFGEGSGFGTEGEDEGV